MLHTLKGKITLFCLFIILVSMSSVFFVVYDYSNKIFQKTAEINLHDQVDLIANDLSHAMDKVGKDVIFLSKTPPIMGIARAITHKGRDVVENSSLEQWEKRAYEIFTALLRINANYVQIRFIGVANEGKEIIRVSKKNEEVYITEKKVLQSKSKSHFYQQALRLGIGDVMFSEIEFTPEQKPLLNPNAPTMRAITPVYLSNGELFGIIVINVNIENYISDILLDKKFDHNLVISDNYKNKLIFDAAKQDLFFKSKSSVIKTFVAKNYLSKEVYADIFKNNKIFNLEVEKPPLDLLLNDKQFLTNVLFWFILIAIVSVSLIYFFSYKVMSKLSEMASAISHSVFKEESYDLPTHLNDEVGMLARAFKEKTDELNNLALFDSLTGLPTRRSILNHLEAAIFRADRSKQFLACLYIDINDFKKANDNYGHHFGDILLIKFGELLKSTIRTSDYCGRIGGDEFIIIIEMIESQDMLQSIVKRYEESLNSTFMIQGVTYSNMVSGGISLYPDHGHTCDELLKNADAAMYESKIDRTGKIFIYNPIAKSLED